MRGRRAGWLCAIAMACAVWALLTNRALVADATQPGDAAARTADGFLRAVGPRDWSFPRDHGRHDGFKTEWWYFTGNLYESEAGAATQGANARAAPVTTGARRFGYQLTFFRTSLTASAATRPSPWAMRDLYSAHAAVTDVAGGRFLCDDISSRGRPDLAWAATGNLDVKLLDWSAVLQSQDSGGAGAIHLKAGGEGFSYELT
jgi:predicted secreted hydrolase